MSVYTLPVVREKPAQASGPIELSDLPELLASPQAAVRVGKTADKDVTLLGDVTLDSIAQLVPGQCIVVVGRSEARWALGYCRRMGGNVTQANLLTFARQQLGLYKNGGLAICLSGHAGRGQISPLWAPRDELSVKVQPNDLVLRFDDVVPEAEFTGKI